ncbi:MAG: LysR family transcriptional regulator [Lactobacillus crispatus]|nr:LysR family transcriptional regulator [Lactobacillus crispatus]
MNLKQLRYFLVVAEEKQITAAAKRLYCTATIKLSIKTIRERVGRAII